MTYVLMYRDYPGEWLQLNGADPFSTTKDVREATQFDDFEEALRVAGLYIGLIYELGGPEVLKAAKHQPRYFTRVKKAGKTLFNSESRSDMPAEERPEEAEAARHTREALKKAITGSSCEP